MSTASIRVEREIIEERRYERAVDVDIEVQPRKYATEALVVVMTKRSGAHQRCMNGTTISLHVRQTTKAGERPRRGGRSSIDLFTLLQNDGNVYSIKAWLTKSTITRLIALAQQIVEEFEQINWEEVQP